MKKQILFLKLLYIYIYSKLYFWKFYEGPGQTFSIGVRYYMWGP
jgi:hypothetical protein